MTDQESNVLWNEYFYPGTEFLINNFNEKDNELLKEKEASCSFEKFIAIPPLPRFLVLVED